MTLFQNKPFISIILLSSLLMACSIGANKPDGQFLPGDALPKRHQFDITSIENAVPKSEALSQTGNKPYQVFGKLYTPLKSSQDYQAEGVASWYGTKFHGKKTSSGEPYNMYAMSAAHRTLPLPSYVRVTNLANQRSVIIKVNDRGPFVNPDRRIIDLSYVAAAKLGVVATGTARVRLESINEVETIATPERAEGTGFVSAMAANNALTPDTQTKVLVLLQMGAFSSRNNAMTVIKQLNGVGVSAYIEQALGLFKVKSGPYVDASKAMSKKNEIQRLLNIKADIVVESADN